jgi:hypothetical protein
MFHRTRRPAEPPLTGYTRRTTAPSYRRPAIASIAAVVAMTAVAVAVVLLTDNAARAADKAPVASATPTPPEYAPPVPATIPGDGMFLVGKHVKPGVYRSTAGRSCYWERLAGLSGSYVDLIANGGLRKGPHLIEIKASDFAFSSQNCGGGWVMVS